MGRIGDAAAAQSGDALVHKLHPGSLVRSQVSSDERVDHDGGVGLALGERSSRGGQHDGALPGRIEQGWFYELL